MLFISILIFSSNGWLPSINQITIILSFIFDCSCHEYSLYSCILIIGAIDLWIQRHLQLFSTFISSQQCLISHLYSQLIDIFSIVLDNLCGLARFLHVKMRLDCHFALYLWNFFVIHSNSNNSLLY